jgi:hypothetical protein
MFTILSQPYLALDQFLDTKKFDTIIDDIIIGIAKSKYAAGPTNTGPGYLDREKKSANEIRDIILSDPLHPYHTTLTRLKNWEPLSFVQYKWPSHILGQCLVLRNSENIDYLTKHDSTLAQSFKEANEQLKALRQEISDLKVDFEKTFVKNKGGKDYL